MSYRNLQLGIVLTLLFCSLVTTPGCGKSSSKSKKEGTPTKDTTQSLPSRYHFQAKYEDVAGIVEVLINGFPVERGGGSVTNNPIVPFNLTTALIGEGNELTICVEPRMLRREGLSIATVKVYGKVTRDHEGDYPVPGAKITESEVDSAYEAWSKQARAKWTKYREWEKQWLKKNPKAKEKITWKGGGALDSIRAWADRNPLTVSTTFDNEAGPDFSRIFEEAPVITDTSRLKDYAMHLRDLMAEKDTAALFEEFRLYYAHQYEITGYEGSVEADKKALLNNVVMDGAELDFGREDVRLRRWSNGRVWELDRPDAEAFFQSGGTVREVYVAEIDGSLQVVR